MTPELAPIRGRIKLIKVHPIKARRTRVSRIKDRPIKARLSLNRIGIILIGTTTIEIMTKATVAMQPHLRCVRMVTTRIIPTPARPTAFTARGGLQAESSSAPARGMAGVGAGAAAGIGVVADTGAEADTTAEADTMVAVDTTVGATLVDVAMSPPAEVLSDAAMRDTVPVADSTAAAQRMAVADSTVVGAVMVAADTGNRL